MRQLKRRSGSCGRRRIMPGAFSRASHSVTRNSTASVRMPDSSESDSATCSMALTMSTSCLRRKRGFSSASSMNSSSASYGD